MVLQNSLMDALAGETYARQFAFSRPIGNNQQVPLGADGWGAEFGIVSQDDPCLLLAVATVTNNKAAWVADGVLWISFGQAETNLWDWDRASWYLDLVQPDFALDPNGFRQNVLRGSIRCMNRAPNRIENFQLNNA